MESLTLATQPRTDLGSRATRALRAQGLIPAVVYGHKEDTLAVTLNAKELDDALRHHVRVVDLALAGTSETAIIQEIQFDHLGKEVLHVDFKRVSRDERIVVTVSVELKGTAPGASTGVVEQTMHELEIECLAIDIPESIKVNIGNLHLDEAIHVRDVVVPEGIKLLDDPDAIVVHVVSAKGEPEKVEAATGEETAEPEIVGRRVKEDAAEE